MVRKFLKQNIVFDLIILDPPYFFHLEDDLFKKINNLVTKEGLVIYETYHKSLVSENNNGFFLIKNKKYGSKRINYYKKQL